MFAGAGAGRGLRRRTPGDPRPGGSGHHDRGARRDRCGGAGRQRRWSPRSRHVSSTASRPAPASTSTARPSSGRSSRRCSAMARRVRRPFQEISVGTQGYVWMLMFSYGFVGLALFLAFLWGSTLRTWRSPGDVDLVLHSVLVVASVIIVVYGLDIMQLLTIMLVAAVLLRRRYGLDDRPRRADIASPTGARHRVGRRRQSRRRCHRLGGRAGARRDRRPPPGRRRRRHLLPGRRGVHDRLERRRARRRHGARPVTSPAARPGAA